MQALNFASNDGLPPQNVEAEESILGGILLDPNAIARVLEIGLKSHHFYVSSHYKIYAVMTELYTRSEDVNLHTVTERLSEQRLLDEIGGKSKMIQLAGSIVSAINIDSLAQLVINKACSRQLISVGHQVTGMGYSESMPLSERLEKAEKSILAVKAGIHEAVEPEQISVTAYRVLEQIEDLAISGEKKHLPTGIYNLDEMLSGGLYPGNLVILGARPGCGKSMLSGKIAYEIARIQNQPTLILSLEMSKDDVVQRYLSEMSGVLLTNIRQAKLTDNESQLLARAAGEISEIPVLIDDSESVTLSDALSIIRKAVVQKGVKAVVIDYLQLMQFPGKNVRALEIGEATRELKKLAKQLQIPIILLSQLNRGVESRSDKRPMSSDLKESGDIEQDADIILMLYRDEYYNKESEERGIMEIICTKHRNGATGTVKVLFDGEYCRIRNMARRD